MLKYFMNLFALLFILGLILFGISFVSNLSMWYGISIVKGSFYLLLIGLFLHLIQFEFQSNNKKA
ncbi:putative membrane protein YagU involved in acid resistance [Ureibacillus thermosphaericus]|uniref:Putative membrane protein YagU involved in acid resistance n=1 Tax=Ureibacillus thermosphaericus TaxID=51173 RepID=A0A840PTX5_URETH|nr:putative membrane protein YagU involved in acid resistance [Ureibacillus thermosphaericus]